MSSSAANLVPMTQDEFRLIRDLIFEHCGIHLPESVMFVVERRLKPRLPVFGLNNFRDYYRSIRYGRDPQREIDEIVDRITTNETYFFRGRAQLKAFSDEILPAIFAARPPGSLIRIWSAGCSSGEEPFTLAILARELPQASGYDFEFTGHDISHKALRLAAEGLYRPASFRETEPYYLDRYFRPEGRSFRLIDTIKNRVRFGHLNLMSEGAMLGLRNLDIIFCRNVMIYFAPESRKRLLDNLFHRLRPGGYLLLGHSESLINVTTGFQLEPLINDIVYRRPDANERYPRKE